MNRKSGKAVFAVIILVLVLSVLPMGNVLASNGPVDVSVTVKNMTGGTVTLRMVDESNTTHWFTFDGQGMFKVSVPEGHYSYYASTPCGSESGEFNLNVSKSLKFYCDGGLEVSLTKPEAKSACGLYAWYHGPGLSWGHWHPEEDTSRTPTWDLPEYWGLLCTDGDPTYGMWW